jgi:hypothetical protein
MVGAVALGLLVTVARAGLGEVEPIHVLHTAPAECPPSSELRTQIWSRTPRARLAQAGERARTFAVSITQEGGTYQGRLRVEGTDGSVATRALSGATCAEVSEALALVAAMAIDPPAAPGGPEAVARAPAPVLPSARPAALRWVVGVDGAVDAGLAPAVSPAAAMFLQAEGRGARPASGRLAVWYARAARIGSPGGVADLSRVSLRLDGCPVTLRALQRLDASPCLFFEGGIVDARGHIDVPDSAVRPWLGAGLLVRLRLLVTDAWFVEAEAGVTAPIVRDSFVFMEPRRLIHAVPGLAPWGGVGMGFRFTDQMARSRP